MVVLCLVVFWLRACSAIDPSSLIGLPKESLICSYFLAGFPYKDILQFLLTFHNIELTMRHLHRILRKQKLFRKNKIVSSREILNSVAEELKESGSSYGYRFIHQKCRMKDLSTNRELVRLALKALDPEGVKNRSLKKFTRRKYTSVGPNYMWHIDGYDKLKPFGFAIHGAIDGYNRKILWLHIGSSNNNPRVIASYYLDCVSKLNNVIPMIVRSDRGTENVVLAGIQQYFRHNDADQFAGRNSFRYGTSTANQRIEAWWSQLRRHRANWWINFFKDMTALGIFDASNEIHLQCIRFCFLPILQRELNDTVVLWNNHYIRASENGECIPGRPDVLYYTPTTSGRRDCKLSVNSADVTAAYSLCKKLPYLGCSDEFLQLATLIMRDSNLSMPLTAQEGKELFENVINEIEQL